MIRFYSLFEPFRKAFSFCINKINNNNALALLIIFLCTIFIKLYFIQLGTITTDEGYYLSYSLNLKEALFYTPRDYNFYYTALIGHFFLKMFSAKLLGLRILQILNYLFLFYIIFKFLNKKIPNICIVLGTIFSLLTICSIRPLSFYYDDLSVTLCILSMYFLFKGTENGKNYQLIISGFILGANIFARSPNIVYAVLLGYPLLSSGNFKEGFRKFSFCIAGFFIGIASSLLVIHSYGSLEGLAEGLNSIYNASHSEDDRHNLLTIFLYMFGQLKAILITSLKYMLFFVPAYFFAERNKTLKIIFSLFFVAFLIKSIHTFYVLPETIMAYYLSWITCALLYIFITKKEQRVNMLFLFAGQYIIAFGSDHYLRVSLAFIYSGLTVCMVFYILYLEKKKLTNAFIALYTIVLFAAVFTRSFSPNTSPFISAHTIGEMKHPVSNCDMLAYTKTDSASAKECEYFMSVIKPKLKSHSVLIGNTGDIKHVVHMYKNVYNGWPKDWGTNESVYKSIISTYKKNKEKPDVLLRKEDMKDSNCPEIRFMKEVGKYKMVLEDKTYKLFVPETK